MNPTDTPGARFRNAVETERPLQVVGVVNAYCALLAERAGFRALYLSGAGVANASFGMPDLAVTTLNDVVEDARRITGATDLPLLVDCDTGWGSPLTIARTVREMTRAGVAAIHLEDQVDTKRCGHRPGKQLVSTQQMIDRLSAAVDARTDETLVLMARTDAAAVEGIEAAINRANRYVEAGAEMIFAEALTDLEQFRQFTAQVSVPVLANMTEFGRTPLYAASRLNDAGDEFKIEITRLENMDRVRVTVEPSSQIPKSDYGPPRERIARALKGSLGIDVEVVLVPYGSLPRTTFKAKRLFDLRENVV